MSTADENSVDDLRQKGNHEFQQGTLGNAISFYTAAIDMASNASPSMETAYIVNLCNRSACYFQMEDLENAKLDASLAWNISKQSNVKSAYRLSLIHISEPTRLV